MYGRVDSHLSLCLQTKNPRVDIRRSTIPSHSSLTRLHLHMCDHPPTTTTPYQKLPNRNPHSTPNGTHPSPHRRRAMQPHPPIPTANLVSLHPRPHRHPLLPTPPPPQTNNSIPKSRHSLRSLDVPARLLCLSKPTQLHNLQAQHNFHSTQKRLGRVQSLLGHSPRPRPITLRPSCLRGLLGPHERALPDGLPDVSQAAV